MPLEYQDIAQGLVLAGLGAFIDPTGLMLPAAVEAGCKLLPAASHEKELERLRKAVRANLPKGAAPEEGYETAVGLLASHFRGARDLYAFGEDPGALADELIRRSGKTLTTGVRGYTRQCLIAFLAACRDLKAEVQALERLFRLDVRRRLEELQRDATADRAALAHLERWVRADILHDPRESFKRKSVRFDSLRPARLLDARAETVPFFGREDELAAFEAWLDGETDFDAWVIAGAGGIGKTRLLLEALDRARRLGWRAGFLKSGLDRRDVEAAAATLLHEARPLLAVIDYAEDRPGLTAALLYPWLDEGGTPRRLVLLCRHHDLLHDALARHKHEGDDEGHAHAYLAGAKVRRLEQNALALPVARRRTAFAEAQAAFLKAGAGPDDAAPQPVDALSPDFFAQKHFGRSLYLHAAAYTSLFGPPKVRRGDLLDFVLAREFDHLERLCEAQKNQDVRTLTDDNLRPVLALATLALAARSDVGEAPGVPAIPVFLEGGGLGDLPGPAREALVRLLARTYPHPLGGSDRMDALRPDPLGEALVFAAVNARPALLDAAFGPLLDAAAFDSAATVLYRTALAFAPEDTGEAWLAERLEQADVLGRGVVVDAFLRQIPITTTGFARFTATLAEGRAAHTRARLDAAPEDEAAMRAHAVAVGTLGIRRSGLGRREAALEATEEAVALYQRLAECNPDAFLPDLASSLNNLGIRYSDLGRREAALEATEEAVAIRRRLAERNPDAFLPDLATSLNNLGNRYSNLGRREEALEATEEAVALYRRLAERNPDAFLPYLATSFGALGSILREEDPAGAADAFGEGISLLTPYFTRLPDAFAQTMFSLVQDYLQACTAAERAPDEDLLAPLLPFFQPPDKDEDEDS